MKLFENLTAKENEALPKFPVYITFLVAFKDYEPDENEKKTAIKYINEQTFACDPLLVEFYNEAEKAFENNMEQLDKDLPKGNAGREAAIKKELLNLEKIALKLGNEYTSALNRSMNSFKDHVSKANHNAFVNFIVPVTIPGITE